MADPFLTIVTRCCQRPGMLSENIASVEAQTCRDLEQVFIVDRERKGIQAADRALAGNKHRVAGRYAYILDDDCRLVNPRFVELVRGAAEAHGPDIIMVKSRRPPGPPSMQGVVPTEDAWRRRKLYHGCCNCLCYVMRADWWREYIHWFGAKPWGGDWWFLNQVLAEKRPKMRWLDEIVADARQLGRGEIFEPCGPGWFEAVAKRHDLENLGGDDWRLRLWTKG